MFDQWAREWGISIEAVHDLKKRIGMINTQPPVSVAYSRSEASVTNAARLEGSRNGIRLWRNNVGACKDINGRLIRYGLCNDSAILNQTVKSSDLIGIKPTVITVEMVGTVIGQFIARECKKENWKYKGSEREIAQLNFINVVNSAGGDANFYTGGRI